MNIGNRIVILRHQRNGGQKSYAGRHGEIVDTHFAGWYVLLDKAPREKAQKKALLLTKDGTDEIEVLP